MEESSHNILTTVVVDKRQVELKSPNMETFGLKSALDELIGKKLTIKEVVTDAHSQVPPVLSMYVLLISYVYANSHRYHQCCREQLKRLPVHTSWIKWRKIKELKSQ